MGSSIVIEMSFHGIILLLSSHFCRSSPVPEDAIIIKIQQWGVVGGQQVVEEVLLNGVPLTSKSQEVNTIIKTISDDMLLPALISANQISALRNHTILRSRECILEGSKLHWTDCVFNDGKVYLTLDHNGTWTAQVPQALALKVPWDREVQRTSTERIRLQEGCIKLMKDFRVSEEQSVSEIPLHQFLIPIFTFVVFTILIIVSILISKKKGLRHPGGVIGSIIHYPKDMTDMAPGCSTNSPL